MQDLHTKCGGLKTKDKEVIPIIVKNPKFCSLSLEHCTLFKKYRFFYKVHP